MPLILLSLVIWSDVIHIYNVNYFLFNWNNQYTGSFLHYHTEHSNSTKCPHLPVCTMIHEVLRPAIKELPWIFAQSVESKVSYYNSFLQNHCWLSSAHGQHTSLQTSWPISFRMDLISKPFCTVTLLTAGHSHLISSVKSIFIRQYKVQQCIYNT